MFISSWLYMVSAEIITHNVCPGNVFRSRWTEWGWELLNDWRMLRILARCWQPLMKSIWGICDNFDFYTHLTKFIWHIFVFFIAPVHVLFRKSFFCFKQQTITILRMRKTDCIQFVYKLVFLYQVCQQQWKNCSL